MFNSYFLLHVKLFMSIISDSYYFLPCYVLFSVSILFCSLFFSKESLLGMTSYQETVLMAQPGLSSSAPSYKIIPSIILPDYPSSFCKKTSKDQRNVNSPPSSQEEILSQSFPLEHSISKLKDKYCLRPPNMICGYTKIAPQNVSHQILPFSFQSKNPERNVIAVPNFNSNANIGCFRDNLDYTYSFTSLPILNAASPTSDGFRRSHRHSIPGHRLGNYLKFLTELSAKGSSTVHLFSTAVISGSSSAPNLKEMPRLGECNSTYLKCRNGY